MILVTGGTGFIGKHLMKKLDAKVFSRSNGDDILDYSHCLAATKGCDTVVHLIGIKSENKERMYNVNVKGTENILKACIENNVKHLIYISTVNVYFPEDNYGRSKALAENIVTDADKDISLRWTVLRPSMVYGEGDSFSELIKIVRQNKVIPVLGNGRRQPVYVEDLVDAIVKCVNNKVAYGKVYTIAGPKSIRFDKFIIEISKRYALKRSIVRFPEWPIKQLIKFVLRVNGNKGEFLKNVISMTEDRHFDISLAVEELGFKPRSFREGLKEYEVFQRGVKEYEV